MELKENKVLAVTAEGDGTEWNTTRWNNGIELSKKNME